MSRDVFVEDNFPVRNLNIEILKRRKTTVEDDFLMFEQELDVLDSSPSYETQPQKESELEDIEDTQLENVSNSELPQNDEMYIDQERTKQHENVIIVREMSERVKSPPRHLDDFVTQFPLR